MPWSSDAVPPGVPSNDTIMGPVLMAAMAAPGPVPEADGRMPIYRCGHGAWGQSFSISDPEGMPGLRPHSSPRLPALPHASQWLLGLLPVSCPCRDVGHCDKRDSSEH